MPAKPDSLDRLVQLLLLVAAVTTIANGAFMLAKPLDWYVFVPRSSRPARPTRISSATSGSPIWVRG